MAWCTKCDKNTQIVFQVRGHPVSVPTVSERYTRTGEYIGYEEGEAYTTDIDSIPLCSLCASKFEFPGATSREEYFDKKKALVLSRWHARKPANPDSPRLGCVHYVGLYVLVCVIFVVGLNLVKNPIAQLILTLAALGGAVGLGVLIYRGRKRRHGAEQQAYEAETAVWQRRLEELQSLGYSETNYRWLTKQ